MTTDNLFPTETAQKTFVGEMAMAANFSDLSARAAEVGDTIGASRYARYAHDHIKEAWRAILNWRALIDQQNGVRHERA